MSASTVDAPAKRSLRPFVILALVLSALGAAALAYYLLNRGYATTDDAQIDGNIYTISPQISGRVATVLVKDNQHVQAGQLLFTLDPRDEDIALLRAQADYAQSKAQYGVTQANAVQAQADVDVAGAALQQAQQDFNRYKSINPNAISQQQLDSATAAIRSAKAKYLAAEAQAQAMQASVIASQATMASAAVAMQNARLQLSYAQIGAPAAGHIAQKTVQPGNVAAPGAGMMAVVGDDVWVTANYKETQLSGIHPGSRATVTVDAIPGVTFKAHVDSIQYGTGAVFSLLPAQNATGNYVKIIQRVPVKIVFDDDRVSQYLLAPGMSVLPSITLNP